MPYSAKELKNNEYYQTIADADLREYNDEMDLARERYLVSGSNVYVAETLRDAEGNFLSYEDPQTELGYDGPWQEVVVRPQTTKIKKDEMFNRLLKRDFTEL